MKHLDFGASKGIAVAVTGALAVTALLAMSTPSALATNNSLLGRFDDQPATRHCDKPITGQNGAVINVPAPSTYCLVNLKQVGAVNVPKLGEAIAETGVGRLGCDLALHRSGPSNCQRPRRSCAKGG